MTTTATNLPASTPTATPAAAPAETPVTPPTPQEVLTTLLEATGDLDTAETLQKALPTWLLNASAKTLGALDKTARDLQASRSKVETDLSKLRPLKVFCSIALNAALVEQWEDIEFDVELDSLELPGTDCGCGPEEKTGGNPTLVALGQAADTTTQTGAGAAKTGIVSLEKATGPAMSAPATAPVATPKSNIPLATQSLLNAAMQNFTANEEKADGFPQGSVVKIASGAEEIDDLTPHVFARLCRKLDLGKQYQTHFEQVVGLRDDKGKTVINSGISQNIAAMKKLLLQLDVQLARARSDISPSRSELLQRLIDANGVAGPTTLHVHNLPLIMQGIEIHGACIWGVVVFSVNSIETHANEWCLVYMPGEPKRPLYEYPSFNAFKEYLTLKLNVKSYKDYFAHCLDEDNKVDFYKTFASKRNLGTIRQLPISVPLFAFMVQSHVGKLQIDARSLVVPTADVDQEQRQKRLLNYIEVGVTVASLAGFFVPGLGQLMMGVAIGQLLGEIYEGVEDWRHGDRQEALHHLLSVVESVAMMAAMAAGQKAVTALVKQTVRAHPEFFGQFTSILNSAGQPRLWKPQLGAYAQSLPADAIGAANTSGFYQAQGKSFGRIGHLVYGGVRIPGTKIWRLEHPTRKTAYSPPLEQHIDGGWRHPGESARGWAGSAYALKRIDPSLADMEELRLDMARRLTQTSHRTLFHSFDENEALSPRLRDMIERFGIENRLNAFIEQMEQGEAQSSRYVQEQLLALPKLKNWPTDHYIKVVGSDAQTLATYPTTLVEDKSLSITVSQKELDEGHLLDTVINRLDQKDVDALLEGRYANGESAQLAKKIGTSVKADRQPFFEQLYRVYDHSDAEEVVKLRKAHPELPSRVAQALLDQAPSVERASLRSTGRVPLALAQKSREAVGILRLDRALSGLYLTTLNSVDSEKLAIQLLARLDGWGADWRLQLHQGALKGTLLASVGKPTALAANTFKLVKLKTGYEAFNGDSISLGRVPAGPEALYEGILKTLPPAKQRKLGFDEPQFDDGARMRGKLLDVALDERARDAGLDATGQYTPEVAEPACVQADPPMLSSKHSKSLLYKVRRLFPLFTEVQADEFLNTVGNDAMAREKHVRKLRHDLERLGETLEFWRESDPTSSVAVVGRELAKNRQTVANQIEDSFRRRILLPDARGRPVCGLKLDGMRVADLPVLPADINFDHIKLMSMKNMQLDDTVGSFLGSFPQIESLELDNNQLSELPPVITRLSKLERLCVPDNQIKLTEASLKELADLRSLQTLNLNGNPLGATPDVKKMLDLRYLSLRSTGLTELPVGLSRLPNLDRVDLRNNVIKDLPAWLFEMPKRFTETLNLRHNELLKASADLLKAYRDRIGIGMGYLEDDLARLDEQKARSIWFPEEAGEQWSKREPLWSALKEDKSAEGLFHLLAELGNTAESNKVREDMTQRVWRVLSAAEAKTALREQLLDLAANPINCTDSAASNFSHLEVAVEVDSVVAQAADAKAPTATLLKLGRGLFRLEQLEQIARDHVSRNLSVDPLEVSLAFRTGLADHYDLPGQPRHMRYASLSGVKASDLEAAKTRVDAAEMSSKWMDFIVRQPFWCDYVRRAQSAKFTDIDEIHGEKIQALFDKADILTSAEYLRQLDTVMVAKDRAEMAAFKAFTSEALKAIDQGVCSVPD